MDFTNVINGIGLYSKRYPIRTHRRLYEDTATNSMDYETVVNYRDEIFNFNSIDCLIVDNKINMEEAYLALVTAPGHSAHDLYASAYDCYDSEEWYEWDDDRNVAHVSHNAKESGVGW